LQLKLALLLLVLEAAPVLNTKGILTVGRIIAQGIGEYAYLNNIPVFGKSQ
jgi:hypothetical protein